MTKGPERAAPGPSWCACASGCGGAAAARETRKHPEADAAGDHRGGADQQEGRLTRTGLGQLAVVLALRGGVRAGVGEGGGALVLGGGAAVGVGVVTAGTRATAL